MTDWLALTLIALFFAASIGWRLREGRRLRDVPEDPFVRAGQDGEASPTVATRRAEGLTAWTRLSGP